MPLGVGIAGHALQDRLAVNLGDTRLDPRFVPQPAGVTPIVSLLVAPMYVGDKRIGTISVHSHRRDAFTEYDLRYLQVLATTARFALANAELYGGRKRGRQAARRHPQRQLEFAPDTPLDDLLHQIAETACACSDFRTATVGLLDERTGALAQRALAARRVRGAPETAWQNHPARSVSAVARRRVPDQPFVPHPV